MKMIETKGLTKKFGNFVANDHINLSVDNQEIKCIVGENGAGKTTLMNMLYGMTEPTEGEIFIRGKKVYLRNPIDAIKAGIGMVHQHFKLVPSLTVYENIMLGIELKKGILVDKKEEIRQVKKLIEKYHFELDPMDKIENISVGSRQRVEILKMLYRNVDILILDEPTAVLTPQEVKELIVNLKNLKAQGKTIIVITHKLQEVMELSDSITVIKHGKVIGNVATKDTNEQELAQMMVGRNVVLSVKNEYRIQSSNEIVYKAENICTVNDYGKKVVNNVSFELHKGEILGIAGVEGNGQSELVKLITGLMEATSGKIMMDGKDVTNVWPERLRKYGMGIIPEDRYAQGLCKGMSIAENSIAGYHGRPEVCHHGIINKKKENQKRDQEIKEFDIRIGNLEGDIDSLSGGNAQKLIVARELSENPHILIACQPTRGIDIGSIEFIHRQLLKYRNEGNSIILISSELSEIMSLSDRIIVMYKGKISGETDSKNADTTKIGLLMAGINPEERSA